MDKSTIAYCQLNRVFGYNPLLGRKLVEAAGGAENVFDLDYKDQMALMGSPLPKGLDMAGFYESARELERLPGSDCWFIGMGDKDYPRLLLECEDAPLGLYVRSSSPAEKIFHPQASFAVVGTRDVSHYGRQWCEKITTGLAGTKERPSIISGLALGVDITAHKTAIANEAPTIAVMATGIDKVYPHMHSYDADMIAASPGSALVTDYPLGTAPLTNNFLRRNRIIAGLADATILIESKIKGGGLMTANLAYSYNREVYALPGKADDLRSHGCNKLISEKKAELIFSVEDLVAKLGLKSVTTAGQVSAGLESLFGSGLTDEDLKAAEDIYRLIRYNRGISKEGLAAKSGLGIGHLASALSILEAGGFIRIDLMGNCSTQTKF